MKKHRLIEIDWPEYSMPAAPARPTRESLLANLATMRAAMDRRGYTHLVVYADREHFGNMLWATGFDPRFEEAVLVIRASGKPLLIVGNECYDYTQVSALVVAGDIRVERCQTLSLLSQPRGDRKRLLDIIGAEGFAPGDRVGVAGWKYFGPAEADDSVHALEVPSILADGLRKLVGTANVENATDLFMHPVHGFRARVTVDEIAAFEFSNSLASAAVKRMLFALRPGMTDLEVYAAGQVAGLPLGCHNTMSIGGNRHLGLGGPTGETVVTGDPMSFNVCHFGSNIARSGWLATSARDLPANAQDYVDAFAGPYIAGVSEWFTMMRPGVSGGDVHRLIAEKLPFETFGIFLNPGHLIHHDEWVSSPIGEGSTDTLQSGMYMQIDIIPSHPLYNSSRMEEGIVIADADLQSALGKRYPDVLARCLARRDFMRNVVGFEVPDEVMPLSDSAGLVPPFFLAPQTIIALS
jgi:Xaa-Pro aminopeptidase